MDVLYVLAGKRTQVSVDGLSDREKAVMANYKSPSKEEQASVHRLSHTLKESPPALSGGYRASTRWR